MRPQIGTGLLRPMSRSRAGVWLAPAALGLLAAGCARDRREITPTTLGTDLKQAPRGRMTPFPWPGQDLSRATPPTVDAQAALASGIRPPG